MQMRYVPDDSTIFWAIGDDSSVIARHADVCGKEMEMTLPFEGSNLGEVISIKLSSYMDYIFSFRNDRSSHLPCS